MKQRSSRCLRFGRKSGVSPLPENERGKLVLRPKPHRATANKY